jgi:hypothetical protein
MLVVTGVATTAANTGWGIGGLSLLCAHINYFSFLIFSLCTYKQKPLNYPRGRFIIFPYGVGVFYTGGRWGNVYVKIIMFFV